MFHFPSFLLSPYCHPFSPPPCLALTNNELVLILLFSIIHGIILQAIYSSIHSMGLQSSLTKLLELVAQYLSIAEKYLIV